MDFGCLCKTQPWQTDVYGEFQGVINSRSIVVRRWWIGCPRMRSCMRWTTNRRILCLWRWRRAAWLFSQADSSIKATIIYQRSRGTPTPGTSWTAARSGLLTTGCNDPTSLNFQQKHQHSDRHSLLNINKFSINTIAGHNTNKDGMDYQNDSYTLIWKVADKSTNDEPEIHNNNKPDIDSHWIEKYRFSHLWVRMKYNISQWIYLKLTSALWG